MFKGQQIPVINTQAPNSILDRGAYHLSYNPSTADYGSRTTAIVLKNTVFLTLNGDHRDALEKASDQGGLQRCFDYFLDNLHQANFMCNHNEIVRADNTFNIEINARKILGEKNIKRLLEKCAVLAESKRAADMSEQKSEA